MVSNKFSTLYLNVDDPLICSLLKDSFKDRYPIQLVSHDFKDYFWSIKNGDFFLDLRKNINFKDSMYELLDSANYQHYIHFGSCLYPSWGWSFDAICRFYCGNCIDSSEYNRQTGTNYSYPSDHHRYFRDLSFGNQWDYRTDRQPFYPWVFSFQFIYSNYFQFVSVSYQWINGNWPNRSEEGLLKS